MLTDIMLDRDALEPDRVRGLRRDEFVTLALRGHFDDERVELLRGEIVPMTPPGTLHVRSTGRIARMLGQQLGEEVEVLSQRGLALWDDSWPQPDVAVVPAGAIDEHADRARLVVEVSDSSLPKDSTVKLALYAEQVPVYWLVDLANREVRIYSQPAGGAYQRVERRGPGEVLTLDGHPGVAIPVEEIVPPA